MGLQVLEILISVAIVLFTVATFFLVGTLKKIEKIPSIEIRLQVTLDKLAEVLHKLEAVINKNHEFESRINELEKDVSKLEDRFEDHIYY